MLDAGLISHTGNIVINPGLGNTINTDGRIVAADGLTAVAGGLTAHGGTYINTNAADGNTAIGNTSNTLELASSGLNVSTDGAITGATTVTTSSDVSVGQHILSTNSIGIVASGTNVFTPIAVGSDIAGTITFNQINNSGDVTVSFAAAYGSAPIVVVSPATENAANPTLGGYVWVTSTPNDFTLHFAGAEGSQIGVSYNYIIIH
jgi:hypothetical protein